MKKEFRFKVIEMLNKSVTQIELEVALGYCVNYQGALSHDAIAREAWLAARAFMKEMEKAYEAKDLETDHSTPSKET
jgi:hypothetical protein